MSPNEAEAVEIDDITLEGRRNLLRDASLKSAGRSKQSVAADDSGSSSPPVRAGDETAPARDPAVPPSKRARAASDFFDLDVLLTVVSS